MTPAETFEYSTPTTVIGGPGVAARAGSFASLFGTKALIVCGNLSAHRSGALADVIASLDAAGVPHELLEGVPTNPGCALVDAGIRLVRAAACDVVIGIGGGSSIDVAKAIAVGAEHPSTPVRSLLSGIRASSSHIAASLPVIAIPTIPGSGSELNGTSVLIDELTGRKLSMHGDLATPRVALLDGTYALTTPTPLLAAAIGDALCHALEAALSRRATIASDTLARAAITLIREHAVASVNDRADGDTAARADALLHCLWAAGMAGQALTLAGSIVTHPLSHPVSARLGTHHGVAVSAIEPTVIAALADRWQPGRAREVARWMGTRAVAKSATDTDAAYELAARLTRFNKSIGITRSLADEGLVGELVPDLVRDCLASGSRGLANVGGDPLTETELSRLLQQALESEPHRAPVQAQPAGASAR